MSLRCCPDRRSVRLSLLNEPPLDWVVVVGHSQKLEQLALDLVCLLVAACAAIEFGQPRARS
jgi:hypothetical protein